jgi:hypothetical protein
VLSKRCFGAAQRCGHREYCESLIQFCDAHDIIPFLFAELRSIDLEALSRRCGRWRSRVRATWAARKRPRHLQNRNKADEKSCYEAVLVIC